MFLGENTERQVVELSIRTIEEENKTVLITRTPEIDPTVVDLCLICFEKEKGKYLEGVNNWKEKL